MTSFLPFIGFLASWGLLKLTIPFLQRYLLDQPNSRSSHNSPTPRGGGISFVLIGSILSIVSGDLTPLIAIPIAILGLVDDLVCLPAKNRYLFQVLIASSIIFLQPLSNQTLSNLSLGLIILMGGFLVFSTTAVINFINFMDGLDGLVAGCMVIILSTASISTNSSILPLIGSILGFLVWNWAPAKVFMGDIGSTFLGTIFVGIILKSTSWSQCIGLILVATPLLADPFFCVIRRFKNNHKIFDAHRLHLYQRLNQAGWTHSNVAILYVVGTLLLAIIFLSFGLKWTLLFSIFEIIFGAWIDFKVAISFRNTISS